MFSLIWLILYYMSVCLSLSLWLCYVALLLPLWRLKQHHHISSLTADDNSGELTSLYLHIDLHVGYDFPAIDRMFLALLTRLREWNGWSVHYHKDELRSRAISRNQRCHLFANDQTVWRVTSVVRTTHVTSNIRLTLSLKTTLFHDLYFPGPILTIVSTTE